MNLRLTGKRVLITAGAAGIGLAIAEGFAAEGARVHVARRRRSMISSASCASSRTATGRAPIHAHRAP